MKRRRISSCEQLEYRHCLSAVAFIRNIVGTGEFPQPTDLDRDGDTDIVFVSDNGFDWYQNMGSGQFGEPQRLVDTVGVASNYVLADVDGDHDVDIIATTTAPPTMAWYENKGERGFGEGQRIAGWFISIVASDIDGDDDVDILATQRGSAVLFENTDGAGAYRRITGHPIHRAMSISTADLDDDGDMDILSSDFWDGWDGIAWYRNEGSQFTEAQVVAGPVFSSTLDASDLDGDGDLDVLAAGAWFENTDGLGNLVLRSPVPTLGDITVSFPFAIPMDVDRDGDLDVVQGTENPIVNLMSWHENLDGTGSLGEQQVINTDRHTRFFSIDLDKDGDQEILTSIDRPDRILLYGTRIVGDSNDDGVFDSSDLVIVFQADKYQDGIPGNATFDEGDWNQDGDFDSGDFVFAFQAGHYVPASTPIDGRIAGAVDLLFAKDDDRRTFVA